MHTSPRIKSQTQTPITEAPPKDELAGAADQKTQNAAIDNKATFILTPLTSFRSNASI